MFDYLLLFIVSCIIFGGGLYLISEAKKYRIKRDSGSNEPQHVQCDAE